MIKEEERVGNIECETKVQQSIGNLRNDPKRITLGSVIVLFLNSTAQLDEKQLHCLNFPAIHCFGLEIGATYT